MKALFTLCMMLMSSLCFAQTGDEHAVSAISSGKWNTYTKEYDWSEWTPVTNVSIYVADTRVSVYKGSTKYFSYLTGEVVPSVKDDAQNTKIAWYMTDNDGKRGIIKLIGKSKSYEFYMIYKDVAYIYSCTKSTLDSKLE